jgi:DNA-binding response OmpR family regulator
MRLLLAEDNPRLGQNLRTILHDRGFTVDWVKSAGDAEAALFGVDYKILILDLGLPDADGTTLLKNMRQRHDMRPVLVLTARDSKQMLVDCLNSGADDYVVKPFEIEELVARIRALLRRPASGAGTIISEANMQLDTVEREVRVNGIVMKVPRREFDALLLLVRRSGGVVSKSTLTDMLYAFGEEIASNALEVLMHRLRRRLQDAGAEAVIHTIRGVGYMMTAGVKQKKGS